MLNHAKTDRRDSKHVKKRPFIRMDTFTRHKRARLLILKLIISSLASFISTLSPQGLQRSKSEFRVAYARASTQFRKRLQITNFYAQIRFLAETGEHKTRNLPETFTEITIVVESSICARNQKGEMSCCMQCPILLEHNT